MGEGLGWRYNFNMQRKKFRIPVKKFSKKEQIALQKRMKDLHARIRAELAGRDLPNPAEMIRQGREERDKQLLENIK